MAASFTTQPRAYIACGPTGPQWKRPILKIVSFSLPAAIASIGLVQPASADVITD